MKHPIRVAFMAIAIIPFFGQGCFSEDAAERDNVNESSAPTGAGSLVPGTPGAINVDDQRPGMTVNVSMVYLSQPGWVDIHVDDNGKPGSSIGNSELIQPGTRQVTVNLKRATNRDEAYYAMLHQDDGDGVYEFPGSDVSLKDPQGNVLMMRFRATDEAVTP